MDSLTPPLSVSPTKPLRRKRAAPLKAPEEPTNPDSQNKGIGLPIAYRKCSDWDVVQRDRIRCLLTNSGGINRAYLIRNWSCQNDWHNTELGCKKEYVALINYLDNLNLLLCELIKIMSQTESGLTDSPIPLIGDLDVLSNPAELKDQLLIITRLSINYHGIAERRYSLYSDLGNLTAITLSAGNVATILGLATTLGMDKALVSSLSSTIVMLASSALLAFNISRKASDHSYIRKEWLKVEGEIQVIDPIDENLSLLKEKMKNAYLIKGQESLLKKSWVDKAQNQTIEELGLES